MAKTLKDRIIRVEFKMDKQIGDQDEGNTQNRTRRTPINNKDHFRQQKETKKLTNTNKTRYWQEIWDQETTGRPTHKIIRTVKTLPALTGRQHNY